jgi:hypothetical protein
MLDIYVHVCVCGFRDASELRDVFAFFFWICIQSHYLICVTMPVKVDCFDRGQCTCTCNIL